LSYPYEDKFGCLSFIISMFICQSL
jgi:hypothetical protein